MIEQFLLPSIYLLQDMGLYVHVACNFKKGSTCSTEKIIELIKKLDERNIVCHPIDFSRNIMHISENYRAYQQTVKIIGEHNFSLVHCHSPIGGLITRFACRHARLRGTKVLYTAHGFHFYKGAPLKNWLMYYPIEKFCSHFTDMLITINREDYDFACRKMNAKRIEYVPGVGINTENFRNTTGNRTEKRGSLGIPEDAFLMISVGELNLNKNHQAVLRAMSLLNEPAIHYAIAGIGDQREPLRSLAEKLGLSDRVHLLGYRNDIAELYHAADLFVFPSFREGLPVALMEAMASGLPCVVSKIRGNTDLIQEAKGGFLCETMDVAAYAEKLNCLARNPELREKMGRNNLIAIRKFSIETVTEEIRKIYSAEFAE